MAWDGQRKSFGILVDDCGEVWDVKIKAGRTARVLPAMPDVPSEWRAVQGAGNQGRFAVLQARARGGFAAETARDATEVCAAAAEGLKDGAGVDRRGSERDHRQPD